MRHLPASVRALDAPLRAMIASDALSVLSLMAGFVVLPWWVVRDGGAGDLTVWAVALSAVSLIAMPLLSPLADLHRGRRLILGALALCTASSIALAVLASAGHYQFGLMLALRAVSVVALAVFQPATNRLMTELAPAGQLGHVVSLQQGAQSIGRLIGPALGGAMLTLGVAPALWLHALLLVAATLLASRLPDQRREVEPARRRWWFEFRAGLQAIWRVPLERHWNIVNFVSWVFLFPALTMLLPLRVRSLGLPGLWLGLCEAGMSLGLLAGALGLSRWSIDRFGRYATRVVFAMLQGFALAGVGAVRHPVALVALFALSGLSTSALSLIGLTHRSLARPEAFRARMFAGSLTMTHLAATLGPAVAGAALLQWDVSLVYVAFGALGGLTSLAMMAVPGFRAFMRASEGEANGWYARHHPEAFAAPAAKP